MRCVFMDIDGVLNSEDLLLRIDDQHRQLGHSEPTRPKRETTCECYRLENLVDRDAVARFNRLVAETDAKVVVSSSWRRHLDPPDLDRALRSHGLVGEIVGQTPVGSEDPEMQAVFGLTARIPRGHEIDHWLKKHPEVEGFVILDDGADMTPHAGRHVRTDCHVGLVDVDVDLAIRLLLSSEGP